MENASKALIIAGAILLAILIITLGIFIFQQASEVTRDSSISDVEIIQFNEKFTSHEGTNVRGSEVNSLLSTVVQNNVANQDDTSKQVAVQITSNNWQNKPASEVTPTKTSSVGRAQTGRTYQVTTDTEPTTGYVNKITITDSGSGNTAS